MISRQGEHPETEHKLSNGSQPQSNLQELWVIATLLSKEQYVPANIEQTVISTKAEKGKRSNLLSRDTLEQFQHHSPPYLYVPTTNQRRPT